MTAASLHPNHRPSRPEVRRARGRIALAALAGMLALATQTAWSQAASRLEKVELHPQPGEQVEVRLVLDGPAPAPVTFTIDNPARLAVDLPGTALALDSRRIDVKSGGVDTIVAAEASGRTRLVFNLDRMQPYNVRTEGNTVFVTVGGGAMATAAAPAATTAAQAAAAPIGGATTIQKVDFRRTSDGGGRIVVQTIGGARTQASLKREGGRLVVDFPNTQLGADQARRYDVTDFATPVSSFDVTGSPTGARLVVAATGDYEPAAYQTDREYALELKPVSKAAAAAQEKKEYKGERLTLNFQDIETRAVLQLLAETSGLNIVVSDTVQGSVTLRLQNVPWDQALDIVMTTKGLDMRRNGNVIIVAPAEEIAAREQAELEALQALQTLEPLRSEFIQVNYAKAAELATLIQGEAENTLLSDRGSVAIDERTNTLLVNDTATSLANVRRLVTTLDIPVQQVLIESRVVIVNDDYSRELGVRFGATAANDNGGNGLIGMTGTALGAGTMVGTPTIGVPAGSALPVPVPAGPARYNVNLPVSTPGIVATNQREARILQGTQIPYQESSSSGAATTSFKDAVLSLTVVPQITPDDHIIMDLTVTKDSVGELVPSGGAGGFIPSIDKRELVTQVVVADGETVVLGGVYETELRSVITKVPGLGNIPGLGYLFRK